MRPLILALAVGCAVPAAAQEVSRSVYDQAVEARLAGDPARAVALLEPLVVVDPRNSDALVQLGLAHLALGQLDSAETAFKSALAFAPGYSDAQIGLARIARRRGDHAGALRTLDSLGADNSEVAALRRELAGSLSEPRWQIDMDAAYSWLDGPQPDWRELAIQVRRSAAPATIGARIEYARRFDRDDIYGEAQIDYRLSDAARMHATLGGAPNADFRPEWQLSLGGSFRIKSGPNATILTLDGRQSRFAVGDVQSLSPGIEQYVGGRFWLTGRWINLFDERGTYRSGFQVRGDVQASEPLRLFAGYSNAPDTDEGVVVDVHSFFGGISLNLGRRHLVRVAVAHDDRAKGANRTQLTLGLGLRF